MTQLRSRYLGMDLRTPLVASPSPRTGHLDDLLILDDCGIGAVVLPSLFEEEIEAEAMTLHLRLEHGAGTSAEADDYFAEMEFDHLGLDRHLQLVADASSRLQAPVIASINGTTVSGWVSYARDLVSAGAAAIELNMYAVALDPAADALQVESQYAELVRRVRAAVDVPIAVKLSPYFTSLAHFARQAVDAGADGLTLFNRFYQPDLDLVTRDVTPALDLSHPGELRLPLRWIAILRPQLPATSLALTSGVQQGTDVAKGLLAGADVVMTTAELLRQGPARARGIIDELSAWMAEHEYESVDQLRGSVAAHTSADPAAFERAQYQRVLRSWVR
ncbi:MAG: dihydroorotate dehydrogenase-like protein [Actinomycetales bacterium]|nr:dihydroorotate dehydrogenase-like protein [Actinomycetales bacterium]